jgi:bifunctional DNA-binding transcriptional regulator/antitoxin component of YhaV-PrlF toxin-antitoxin module
MSYVVGPKGQIVIAKELRDQLGVSPGWTAIQRVTGDHLEVFFMPPSHRRSLKGTLSDQIGAKLDAANRGDGGNHSDRVGAASQLQEFGHPPARPSGAASSPPPRSSEAISPAQTSQAPGMTTGPNVEPSPRRLM